MKIIGFNFKKIHVERISESFKNLKINTNIDVSNISKIDTKLFQGKEEIVKVEFKYSVTYDPNIAKIEFQGVILISVDPSVLKEILKQWDDKTIPEEFRFTIFNVILRKSNLRALQLEDEMNLPLHLPLPRVSKQPQENQEDQTNSK